VIRLLKTTTLFPILALVPWFESLAQTPAPFEIVSIKPAPPNDPGPILQITAGGTFNGRASVATLIQMAYNIKPFLISGAPKWLGAEEFRILAKPPEGGPAKENPTLDSDVQQRLQALLADRFHLVIHREPKEMPVYALVVAKTGLKLHEVEGRGNFKLKSIKNGVVNDGGAKIGLLVSLLANHFDRPVLDETGLTGYYRFNLSWAPDPPPGMAAAAASDPAGPSLFTALQEQAGLKLEAVRRPVPMLVIDHVERPSEN
jgi:uncharacterized protein (TIGR03435 family)